MWQVFHSTAFFYLSSKGSKLFVLPVSDYVITINKFFQVFTKGQFHFYTLRVLILWHTYELLWGAFTGVNCEDGGLYNATYNTTQLDTTRYDTTQQHDTTQHDTTRRNTKIHDTTQHNTTQHDTTQHVTIRHNTTRHDTTRHNTRCWF